MKYKVIKDEDRGEDIECQGCIMEDNGDCEAFIKNRVKEGLMDCENGCIYVEDKEEVKYKIAPEIEHQSCKGCVAYGTNITCTVDLKEKVTGQERYRCSENKTIFVIDESSKHKSKYTIIEEKHKGGVCTGCVMYHQDCTQFRKDRVKEGLLDCDKAKGVYVLKNTKETDPIPELKAGMVIDHGDEGLCILLPEADGTLGMYRAHNGLNPTNNALYNEDEIKAVYEKPLSRNYSGVIGISKPDVHLWNKLWERINPELVKIKEEISSIEKQIEELESKKEELEELL